jgi:putative ABC transport system permease protein
MRIIREWILRTLGVLAGRRDHDLEQELRAHAALAAEAGRTARANAGSVAHAADALRDQRGVPWLDHLARDLRHALRTLRRSPTFTGVSLVTLTLGIGATAAVFQLLDAIGLRSLPVPHADRLAIVELADMTRWEGRRTSGYPVLTNALWEQFRTHERAFDGVLAWSNVDLRLHEGGAIRAIRGLLVSGDFFNVLGVTAAHGRMFVAADDRAGCGVPGVVVSHGFWQRQLGGDPGVIGGTITVNARRVEVIGVTPPGFVGVEVGRAFDVALPICSEPVFGPERDWLTSGTTWWLTVMGRLPPGRTIEQATAELQRLSPGLFAATVPPGFRSDLAAAYRGLRLRAVSGAAGVSGVRTRFRNPLVVLFITTGFVLLIVCTNLASLVLSRAVTRQRELAVRQALGASQARILQQVMAENVLLALGGAAAGLAIAGPFSRGLLGFLGDNVTVTLETDRKLAGVVIGAAVLMCLVYGLVPAWRAARAASSNMMQFAGLRGSVPTHGTFGVRHTLVIAQVAVSAVLLVGALLFVATLRNLLDVDAGFQYADIAWTRIDASPAPVPQSRKIAFKSEVLDRIRRTSGVIAAAEVRHVPMSNTGSGLMVWLDGADPTRKTSVFLNAISDGYLRTMGIRLLAGRDFAASDSAEAPKVALVNPSFVRRLGIAGNPVGARFSAADDAPDGSSYEIVGLVADTKYFDLNETFQPIAFVPIAQIIDPRPFTDVVIRSLAPPAEITSSIQRTLAAAAPLAAVDVRPLARVIEQRIVRERLMATLSAFFGVIAVLVVVIGLYGVVNEFVTRRRGEIGVRMALGARRSDIATLVLRQAGLLLGGGLVLGVPAALAATTWTRSLLSGLQPGDIAPIALACASLAAAALVAIVVPLRRAATMDPIAALRQE